MGADFIWFYLPAFKMTLERRKVLSDIIDQIDHEYDVAGFYDDEHEYRKDLVGALDEVANLDINRQVDQVHFEGMDMSIWLTGGMSWGDDPTDISRVFFLLSEAAPLWDKFEEFAREEMQESHKC